MNTRTTLFSKMFAIKIWITPMNQIHNYFKQGNYLNSLSFIFKAGIFLRYSSKWNNW